jgi:transposase
VIVARRGSKPKPFGLNEGDEVRLRGVVDTPTVDNRLAQRARILLLSASGVQPADVAERLGVSKALVGKWKRRYRELGFAGLGDAPRTGRPTNITDEKVADVVRLTLEEKPKGATHWSTRDLAKRTGLNQTRVSRIWRAFSIRPHLAEKFQLSTDPQFIEKVRDVVGLYLTPPANSVVFSIDEKTQVQALNRTQAILPTRPGMVERRTPEYRRHGTTDLFAALNVASGKVISTCKHRHRSREFTSFLDEVEESVEPGLDIHCIVDNHSAHKSVGRTWLDIPVSTCISRRPMRRGSTWWRATSAYSPSRCSSAGPTRASRSWRPRSTSSMTRTTRAAGPFGG